MDLSGFLRMVNWMRTKALTTNRKYLREEPTGIFLFMDKYAVYKSFIFDVSPISLTSLPSLKIQFSLPIQ
jgi:hypothetical protein